jgi:hypothetical protein
MSNADVFGSTVNMAQRMEDSGRYKFVDGESGATIQFDETEVPHATLTVTQEVYEILDKNGTLAKLGADMHPKQIIIKGEQVVRNVFCQYFSDVQQQQPSRMHQDRVRE